MDTRSSTSVEQEKLQQQRPRVEIHTSPSIGGASVLSDYPVIEREGDDGPYKLATRRGKGGPVSIAWVQEVRAVFRSDAHDLVVVTTDSPSVYLMTIAEYESRECRIDCVTGLSQPNHCYTRRLCGMKGQDHG